MFYVILPSHTQPGDWDRELKLLEPPPCRLCNSAANSDALNGRLLRELDGATRPPLPEELPLLAGEG